MSLTYFKFWRHPYDKWISQDKEGVIRSDDGNEKTDSGFQLQLFTGITLKEHCVDCLEWMIECFAQGSEWIIGYKIEGKLAILDILEIVLIEWFVYEDVICGRINNWLQRIWVPGDVGVLIINCRYLTKIGEIKPVHNPNKTSDHFPKFWSSEATVRHRGWKDTVCVSRIPHLIIIRRRRGIHLSSRKKTKYYRITSGLVRQHITKFQAERTDDRIAENYRINWL